VTPSSISATNLSPNPYSQQYPRDRTVSDQNFGPQTQSTQSSTSSSHDNQMRNCSSLSSSQCSSNSSIQTLSETSITKSEPNKFKKDFFSEGLNKDMRLKIKREKNREAAAKCRKKKLRQIGVLENHKYLLIDQNLNLENEVKLMREKVFEMKQLLLNHRIGGICLINPRKD